ncbi:DUF2269 family protein [Tritonibacter scottomollicae]|uniref:DUF2269 family protein n=1 Tax=Tritonibacter scottomollicae TaxID=483013 RepID=UPI003AA8FDE2
MDWGEFLRAAHVLGACVLIGTGSGIAFFMLMAHRTSDPSFVAQTASVVVVADMLFTATATATATAAIAQPIIGYLLMQHLGWSFSEGWLALSLALYVFIRLFCLPVVWIQTKMRDEARISVQQHLALTPRYNRLYRIWFACGVPAFSAIVVLLWLMVTRPHIAF